MDTTQTSFPLSKPTSPEAGEWAHFLLRCLLVFGTVLTVAGVVFFVAAYWQEFGRFGKFAALEGALLAAAVLAWRIGIDRLGGKVALTAAAMLVGALIALYGQTYRTGADAWENFLLWAALILPWVLAARFSALWLLWLGVANLAVRLYGWQTHPWDQRFLVAAGVLNGVAWIGWEMARRRGVRWLDGTWGPRLIGAATLLALLGPSMTLIYGPISGDTNVAAGWAALGLLLPLIFGSLRYYRQDEPQVFMLALVLAAAVTLLTTFFVVRLLVYDPGFGEAGVWLASAVFLLTEISAATWWLREVTLRMEARL